jgi:co-chaperonin GroES (HSP10)
MAIPKSAKLLKEEAAEPKPRKLIYDIQEEDTTGPIKIKPVDCLNDFVAVLLFRIKSDIELPEMQKYKNEGVVVGVGPGLPDNSGGRIKTQLKIGDVVVFMERNVVMEINTANDPYKGQRIIILSERNLICKLPPVEFTLVNA